jgi:hypothetical protein
MWIALTRPERRADVRMERRRAFAAIGTGALAAVVFNTLFNVFRFGSALNSHYGGSVYQVSDRRVFARFFASLWSRETPASW